MTSNQRASRSTEPRYDALDPVATVREIIYVLPVKSNKTNISQNYLLKISQIRRTYRLSIKVIGLKLFLIIKIKKLNPWHDGCGEPRPTELVITM